MRVWRPALLALAVTTACLFLAAPAHAAFPGQNGKIAFADECGISVVNPDGSGRQQLTTNCSLGDWAPDWSTDGRKIALEFNDDGLEVYGVSVINADGTGRTQVSDFGGDDPTWSPDARRIAIGRCNIRTVRYPPDGTPPTPLTSPCGDDQQPSWSPSGARIAFSSNRDGNFDIYTMNAADGSDVQQVTNLPGDNSDPDWSPDGTQIVFANRQGVTQGTLYKVGATGAGLTQLTPGPNDAEPTWSPDGKKIAWSRSQTLSMMNTDGTGVATVSVGAHVPDWQPILHDAPQSADSLRLSLVPMFRQTISSSQCAARGGQTSTHGAPLAFSSCNPPGYLPNTMARLGPASSSWVQVAGLSGDPTTSADEADLSIVVNATDVRARSSGFDYNPNTGPDADATLSLIVRWTDTYNGATLRSPATTSDFTYSVPADCFVTADPAVGGTCQAITTADALAPGTILEGRRTVMTLSRWWLYDSGLNATRGDGDDRMFAQSGIYVP